MLEKGFPLFLTVIGNCSYIEVTTAIMLNLHFYDNRGFSKWDVKDGKKDTMEKRRLMYWKWAWGAVILMIFVVFFLLNRNNLFVS